MTREEFEQIVEERVSKKVFKLPVQQWEPIELKKREYTLRELLEIKRPEGFVRGLYRKLLKREPDPDGLQHYTTLLQQRKITPLDLVEMIATSAEAREKGVKVEGIDPEEGKGLRLKLANLRRRIRRFFRKITGLWTTEEGLINLGQRVDRLEVLFRDLNSILERIQERELEELERVRKEIEALHRQVGHLWKFAPPEELPTFYREPVPFSPPPPEGEYQALQDFFVNSKVVKQKLEVYRPYLIKKGEGIWVDAGAGRGEFLELLAEEGIEGVGVEIQLSAVEGLHRKGLRGVLSDINSYLRSRSGPIGGISAIQVIEHLEWDYLEEFIELAYQRLSPGGIIILETPNPAAP
ncbi:MAG: methyltransferase domain-containing protein, partial [Campylobacterales bacterium]